MFMPRVTTDAVRAFGAYGEELRSLLPGDDIPERFCDGTDPWCKVVQQWFFEGLPKGTVFFAKDGISGEAAYKHVASILRSWEPRHEDKEATCAYLLWLWMEKVEFPPTELQKVKAIGGSVQTSAKDKQ
jgi:hypothetical protein